MIKIKAGAHCCKGKMQNIDMSKEIIDKLFDNDKFQIIGMKILL